MKYFILFVLGLLLPAVLAAQPVVAQGGGLNAAGFTRGGLPGDGLPQVGASEISLTAPTPGGFRWTASTPGSSSRSS